jgi:hypothetical protein
MHVSGSSRWIRPTLALMLIAALTTFAYGAAGAPARHGGPALPAGARDVPSVHGIADSLVDTARDRHLPTTVYYPRRGRVRARRPGGR